jgi:putative PIN family toxin of toxin-antitoxin system
MRIVLDTNIYIAAFLSRGLASEVLRLGERGEIELYASPGILKELETRLTDKLKQDKSYIKGYVTHISKSVKLVIPNKKIDVITKDPDDNKILECAVEAKANLIVTMDKHLLKLKSFQNVGIVHPKTLTWIIPKLLKKQ